MRDVLRLGIRICMPNLLFSIASRPCHCTTERSERVLERTAKCPRLEAGPWQGSGNCNPESSNEPISKLRCTGIAFPGCYLLKKEVIKMLPAGSTSLIIKELAQPQVKAVVGYSKAEAFNDQTARVTFSYLSNPLSCTVDAKGDLIYSDGSNHRIRKITSFTTSCSVSGLFSQQQVEDYESTLANVDSACNNVSVQELRTHYANSQQAVLENNSLEMVQQYFCNNGASAHAAVMEQQYTNNLFVLCRACESLTPRPSACPWLELCECRDAMAQADLCSTEL